MGQGWPMGGWVAGLWIHSFEYGSGSRRKNEWKVGGGIWLKGGGGMVGRWGYGMVGRWCGNDSTQ